MLFKILFPMHYTFGWYGLVRNQHFQSTLLEGRRGLFEGKRRLFWEVGGGFWKHFGNVAIA